jgi:hypothetical protein
VRPHTVRIMGSHQTSQEPPDLAARLDAALGRLERIRETEGEIRRLQARQVRGVAAFIAEREAIDADLGVSSIPGAYRSMVAEIALSMGVSVITAQSFMSDAYLLVASHPSVLGAVEAGELSIAAARSVVSETALLDDDNARRLADAVIAEEAVDVLPGKVRALAERRVIEIDPDAAARRSAKERADRHVRLVPAGADTALVDAYLPVEQATACWKALHEHAVEQRAAGDARTLSHLMCDTFVERLTGAVRADQLKTEICVVMSDTTLLSVDTRPAQLVGVGPITGLLARRLAATGDAWVRRLLTDPIDGSLTRMDTRRRRVSGNLRRAVTIADQHCRGIACASPIRDIDHIHEHARGGATSFANSQGLSKGCHRAREHPQMRVTADPHSRATTWTTPTGLVHVSIPPPALGHGSLTPHQLQLRHRRAHPSESPLERRAFDLRFRATRHRAPRPVRQQHSFHVSLWPAGAPIAVRIRHSDRSASYVVKRR